MEGKKAIVTVLIGDYDELKPAPKFEGWDCYLFTDQDLKDSKGWKIYVVVRPPNLRYQRILSRFYKWKTHCIIPDYDIICYMDASMTMIKEPDQLMWFKHPRRQFVYQEAAQIVKLNKADVEDVLNQAAYYDSEGFQDEEGLYQNGFFVRSHDQQTNEFCDMVYKVCSMFTHRDQLAVPFALFKTGYKMNNLFNHLVCYEHVKITPHKERS